MAKFFFFEYIVEQFYSHVFTKPKDSYGKSVQLGVTFASGYLAGVVCAVVSHPADSVVSLMGKPSNKGKSIGTIASEVGILSLATKGLGTRVIMIGTLTGKPLTIIYRPKSDANCLVRFPMVDLRFVQDCHGYGYDWWQVDVALNALEILGEGVCIRACLYACGWLLLLTISLSQLVLACRFTVDSERTYPVFGSPYAG